MKLLEKIVRSIFYQPKPKELSNRCEVFLYPETAEKLKEIQKFLEKEQNKNPYNSDFESSRAELFRKVVGIAYFVLWHCLDKDRIVIIKKGGKEKEKKLWLSSCFKRAL